jgi:diguanylate cyclase (GGDEF)-like protein/PAS domain S-box-containing protein
MKEQIVHDQERQLRADMKMYQAGIFLLEPELWTISCANERLAELFGSTLKELRGTAFNEYVHPAEMNDVMRDLRKLGMGEIGEVALDVRFVRPDGADFRGYFTVVRLERDDGSFPGIMATVYDVTGQREAERKMNSIESNFWEIFNSTNDALFVHDAYTGAIVEANKTVEKMYGYTREEIFFMNVHDFSAGEPPYSLNEAIGFIRKAVEEGFQSYEWLGRKKGGELFWAEVSLTASHIGGEGRVLAVVRDISDRKEIEQRLQFLSTHDSLTGLYNRAHFEIEFERASRGGCHPVSVIMADLDGLKFVNDSRGHAAGDRLIKVAADLLRESLRPDDLVARIGGDEFAILLLQADEDATRRVMERIREAARRYREGNGTMQVRFSLGGATAGTPDEIDGLLNRADMRMYEDKASNKLTS